MQLAFLITGVYLATGAKSDCLSNQTLLDLGFIELAQQNYTNSSVCSSIFNENGGCVSANSLTMHLDEINNLLRARIDEGSSFSKVFEEMQGKLKNAISANSTNGTEDLILQSIKQNTLNSINACLKSLALIHHGAYCLLASQAASRFVTDMGSYIDIKTNLTSVGSSLDACIPLIDATCLIAYGNPISSKSIYSINNTSIVVDISNATCSDLKNYAQCNSTDCATSRRTYIINKLFTSGDVKFVPTKSTFDKLVDFYNQLLNKETSISSRRLALTKTFKLTVEAKGSDLVSIGANSGVEIPAATGSSTTVIAFSFAFVVWILA